MRFPWDLSDFGPLISAEIGQARFRMHAGEGTSARGRRRVFLCRPSTAFRAHESADWSNTMSYSVGQQVVCINDVFSSERYWRATVRTFPKLHAIYTVREIRHAEPLVGFCFYEFANPVALFARGWFEPAFNVKN